MSGLSDVDLVVTAHCPGRTSYDKKLAEGKTNKEALRALKRRISDVVYRQLLADQQRALQS